MEDFVKKCLFEGLNSKGFQLEFEAMADIGGGYECYLFVNSSHLAVVTGENSSSRTRGGSANMVYRHYYCRFGDDQALNEILLSEGISGNRNLLNGEYGPLFLNLMNKIKSFGTRNADLLIRTPEGIPSDGSGGHAQHPNIKGVIPLFRNEYADGQEYADMLQPPSRYPGGI